MKKIIVCLMMIILCLTMSFVACNKPQGDDSTSDSNDSSVVVVDNQLSTAKSILRSMYKDEPVSTPSDYERTSIIKITGGASFSVTWTVELKTENAPEDSVTVVEKDETTVTIKVWDEPDFAIEYNLIATITAADGESTTFTYEYTLPKFAVLSFDEFLAKSDDDNVAVEGYITGILSKSLGDSNNGLYIQDPDFGGYYVYNLTEDPLTDLKLAAGMKVRVKGSKDTYNGTLEIVSASVQIIEETPVEVTPVDLTQAYTAAAADNNLKAEALVKGQAMLVTVKGVEVGGQDASNGYYYFKLAGMQSYVRISSSVCPLNKEDTETFKQIHSDNFGSIADVTGVVCVYNDAFYLTPVSVNAFSNFKLPEKTPAEQVAFEKEALTFTANITEDGEYTLQLAGKAYEDVAITWTSDNACAVVNEGKLVVTLPEEAATITLTATLTNGDATDTKTFSVLVDAAVTTEYEAVAITAPVAGTYKIFVDATNAADLGKVLYFDGTLNSKGGFNTTDKAAKAADVVVAAVDGKDNAYTLMVGDKYLVGYLNGTYNNMKLDETAGEWTWNETIGTFTCSFNDKNGTLTEFYFGTYTNTKYNSTSSNMSLSAVSYVTGDNAANIGKTQFVGKLGTLKEVEYEAVAITAPVVGTYKIFVDATNAADLGKVLYFDGTLNSKGGFNTTDKQSKAADVVVAAVDGKDNTYTLMVGDKYLVGYLNGTYNNMKLDETAGEWTWNETIGTFTCSFNDKNGTLTEFYFGTYTNTKYNSTASAMSLSSVSYVTGDNAANIGKTQFVGKLGTFQKASGETPAPEKTDAEKLAEIVKKTDTTVTDSLELDAGATWTVKEGTALTINEDGSVTVTRPAAGENDATVVLTATLGEATQEVTITVKAQIATSYAGTAEDPYSVEDALAVAGTLAENGMIENKVYVKGYLKSVGEYGSYYKTLYLVDALGNTQELLVYTCNLNSDAGITEAYQNDLVVIAGYIKNHYGTLELAQNENDFAKFVERTVGTSTISTSSNSSANATVTLSATSGANGTTFTFTVSVADCHELVSVKVVDGTGTSAALTAVEGTYTATIKGNTAVLVETKEVGAVEPVLVATFTCGDDSTAAEPAHKDGSEGTYEATVGSYSINVTGTSLYTQCTDAKGNGCFRFGTSKKIGSITFTVADDVKKVKIYIAKYKANATKVKVNGGDEITITNASTDGAYDVIEIDTTTTKTITIETTSSGKRAMVNTIEYYA